jgi:ribosomal protein S18 acetylase RimI-like enzyme
MINVSEFSASDIPGLRSFVLEAWKMAGPSALGWIGATDENIGEIASDDFLHGLLDNPNMKVFIGKSERDVGGFCAIRKMDDRTLELAGIIVRQDLIGKGIGNDLFKKAKQEAIRSGYKMMIVKTETTNERALSFYQNRGFVEQEKVLEELSGTKVNLTVLKLSLREK